MKKIKKNIIICVEKNTTERDLSRFGVKYLSKFYNVDIINFSNLINKKKNKISKLEKKFRNFSDFLKLVKLKKYICAIDYLRTSEIQKTYKIKEVFQKNNVKLIQVHNGLLPINVSFSQEKLLKIFNFSLLKKYLSKKWNNFFLNKKIIYDISLISGLKAEEIFPETQYSKEKIYTHSFDYETTLAQKKIIKKSNLGIFIDENLITHPDYNLFGLTISNYKKEYYNLMRQTLKLFEKKYNMKIIVCVHPSLINKNYKNFYKGFKCIIGKTEKYSNMASIVFIHQSTAISFPVINKKPLVFLNYSKLKGSFLYENIRRMSQLFNKKEYFIDREIIPNKKNDFKINKKCYLNYLDNYIVHPNSNKRTSIWHELVNALKK